MNQNHPRDLIHSYELQGIWVFPGFSRFPRIFECGARAAASEIAMYVQGDHTRCSQPPVDTKKGCILVPGPHTKTELMFGCQQEVGKNLNGHPVHIYLAQRLPWSSQLLPGMPPPSMRLTRYFAMLSLMTMPPSASRITFSVWRVKVRTEGSGSCK